MTGQCQICGQHGEVRAARFIEVIGLLIALQWRVYQGVMCKACARRHFRHATLVTLLLGWLSVVSILLVPFFILYNIIRYIPFMSMSGGAPRPQQGASRVLTPVVRDRLDRFRAEIGSSLKRGADLDELCREISDKAIVPESDVRKYIEEECREPR